MHLKTELNQFLSDIDDIFISQAISKKSGLTEDVALSEFLKYKNEAYFALRIIGPYLDKKLRILEVGAGSGIFSLFLASQNFKVTALEPVGIGYDFMRSAFEALKDSLPDVNLPHLNIGAESLNEDTHGSFDLIFSIHVLEHLPDLNGGAQGIANVLAAGGSGIHVFPNYAFPYDPHFSIPLIPFIPEKTKYILPKRISKSGKWASINFLTYRKLRKIFDRNNMSVELGKSMLIEMIDRVETDIEFGKRHGKGVSGVIINILRTTRLLKLVKFFPKTLSSPVLIISKKKLT